MSIQRILPLMEQHLASQGVSRGPTTSVEEIEAFESRYSVRLPKDVRAYFDQVNGFGLGADGSMDNLLLSFWNLAQIRPISEECPDVAVGEGDRFFAFADYSIFAHLYAIRLSSDPGERTPVAVLYDEFLVEVAPTLSAFFERYLAGDLAVLFPDPPAEWRAKHSGQGARG